MSTNWPSSVSTNANLFLAVNALQTKLAAPINAIVTTIPLLSTSNFPTTGGVTIDNEVIFYTGISGANLTGCTRGSDGTTASSHLTGVAVGATVIAAHHNALKDELIALEQNLSDRIGLSTTAILAPSGTAGIPGYTFQSDINSGMFRNGPDDIGLAVNGVQEFQVTTTSIHSYQNHYFEAGSAGSPGVSFSTDIDTGLYSNGANDLGVSVGGTQRIQINTSSIHSYLPHYFLTGSGAVPSISFANDIDTGLYNPGPNDIAITVGGGVKFEITTGDVFSSLPVTILPTSSQLKLGGSGGSNTLTISAPTPSASYTISLPTLQGAVGTTLVNNGSGTLTWQNADGQFNVKNYGAIGNGIADDTAAIQATINALPANGGVVFFPEGKYKITSTIMCGDGVGGVISTKNGIVLMGVASGRSDSESNPITGGSELIWAGSSGGTMVQFNGPINSVRVEHLMFEGALLAAKALYCIHTFGSIFNDLVANRCIGSSFHITAITDSYMVVGGTVQGAANNTWSQIRAMHPVGVNAGGIEIGPTHVAGILDVNQNLFSECLFQADGGQAILLHFCDALTFLMVTTSGTLGHGIYFAPPDNQSFWPSGVAFFQCPIIGSVDADPAWNGAGITFFPYPTGDSEIIPDFPGVWGFDAFGRLFGIPLTLDKGLLLNNGTALLPSLAFESDPNTGLYRNGADDLGITVGGTIRMQINTSSIHSYLSHYFEDGSGSFPGISFTLDTDTGIFRAGPNDIAISVGGGVKFEINTANVFSDLPFVITPTSNQLVLGTTRTVTIHAPTPATSSRIWTLPDLSTSPTFAALEGTQIFTGTKTLSSVSSITSATNLSAHTGVLRLANNSDAVSWRNAADSADLALAVDASNQLTFNGTPLETSALTSAHIFVGNASNSATDTAMTGDISITNTGVTTIGAATVTGSKIAATTITDANIAAAAAIAVTKIATGTANQVLGVNNGGTANEFKTITGTTDEITVTGGVGTITLATPQAIATTSTPTFASETLTATSNQLVLGAIAGPNITVTAPAPAASRTYTIPDGGTSASFVLTQAAQTIAGQLTLSSALLGTAGTVSLPGYSFSGDTNTGIYNAGADDIRVTTNGVDRITANTSSIHSFLAHYFEDGSAASPSLSFSTDINTGIYSVGADDIGLSTGGTLRFDLSTTAATLRLPLTITSTTNQLVLGTTNTTTITSPAPATSRTYTIPDAGATASFVMTQSAQTIAGQLTLSAALLGADGTVSLPGHSFSADTDSGLYRVGANDIALAVNGTNLLEVTTTGITASQPITVTPTSNQLVLGTTRTVTITAPTPATSSRTWTLPDLATSPTFAALEGTQTFTGTKTFNDLRGTFGADIAAGSHKITGLANGTAATDAAAFGQVSMVLLSTATASNSANITFSGLAGSGYSAFVVVVRNVIPVTNSVDFVVTQSAGSGFNGSSYRHQTFRFSSSVTGVGGSTSDGSWNLTGTSEKLGTGSNQEACFTFTLMNADSTSASKFAKWDFSGLMASGSYIFGHGGGELDSQAAATDGIKFACSSGNISSGKFAIYGIKNA